MLKTILLATDGSELSQRAVREAVTFAATYGSRIVGLAVAEVLPDMITPEYSGGYDLRGVEEELSQQAISNAAFIAACAEKAGVPCEVLTVKGKRPYEEILNVAARQGCDSIFMASHGRKGLDKLLLGSETQKVLTYSKIPVLVFK